MGDKCEKKKRMGSVLKSASFEKKTFKVVSIIILNGVNKEVIDWKGVVHFNSHQLSCQFLPCQGIASPD
ncbi:hypothetical protein KIN20_023568 [Parelaphostrongylus tenuis]|uniref:Uncharacterized protein n=1 Tax=Parelaphostrongylus tenuis TaxID=148309 RepID=A0AAD5MVT2_PARTN|nr:hypothetical protein KIN20_023568 [Parelaphostrongylus tenuis]